MKDDFSFLTAMFICFILAIVITIFIHQFVIEEKIDNIKENVEKIDNFFNENNLYKIDGIIIYDSLEDYKIEK